MSIPYFDAHCDTITAIYENAGNNLLENQYHIDLKRLSAYSPVAQVFSIWDGHYREKSALLKSELEKNKDTVQFCRNSDDVSSAAESGKIAVFLSVEGAEQIDCTVEKLRAAHDDDGVVMVNLCWNHDNILCGAAMDGGGGLTKQGRDFIFAAQEMGVIIDLSHASENTFWDVMEITNRPVIASHSNSAALYSRFPRNITDAQFEALVKCGGGTGLNLLPEFLGESPDIGTCAEHIEHFLSLGGEKSVFLGGDLDGIDSLPNGMNGVQDIEKLYEALLRRNHSESLVRDIFYNNLLYILERAT